MKYVIGHKNPDTDAIVSAIAYSYFLKQKGIEAIPGRIGEINSETKFVLEHFNVEKPILVGYNEKDSYYLVDHNAREESIDGLKDEQILGVVDHHRIALRTKIPIYYHAEPIGSTSTIITKFMKKEGVEIPREIAGILLSGILSDTVIFRSVTTTEEDKKIAEELAKIVNVNIEEFGIKMKKIFADVSKLSADEIVKRDMKFFDFPKGKFAVGQVEQVDWDIMGRKEELLKALEKIKEEGYELVALMVTNILEESTRLIFVGNESIVEKAFGKPENNEIYLKGVMSRKKQIVPKVQAVMS